MNTPLKTRAAGLVASIFVTFTTVHVIAGYALPAEPAPVLAQAVPRGR